MLLPGPGVPSPGAAVAGKTVDSIHHTHHLFALRSLLVCSLPWLARNPSSCWSGRRAGGSEMWCAHGRPNRRPGSSATGRREGGEESNVSQGSSSVRLVLVCSGERRRNKRRRNERSWFFFCTARCNLQRGFSRAGNPTTTVLRTARDVPGMVRLEPVQVIVWAVSRLHCTHSNVASEI